MSVRVFLDASVLIAAAGSETGGSRAVLNLSKTFPIKLLISDLILAEVQDNLAKNFASDKQEKFANLLDELEFEYIELSQDQFLKGGVINPKDVHVYSGFKLSKSNFLLTLDKRFMGQVNEQEGSQLAITPGDLISKLPDLF